MQTGMLFVVFSCQVDIQSAVLEDPAQGRLVALCDALHCTQLQFMLALLMRGSLALFVHGPEFAVWQRLRHLSVVQGFLLSPTLAFVAEPASR